VYSWALTKSCDVTLIGHGDKDMYAPQSALSLCLLLRPTVLGLDLARSAHSLAGAWCP
jgi:hypothetical protein